MPCITGLFKAISNPETLSPSTKASTPSANNPTPPPTKAAPDEAVAVRKVPTP